MGVAGLLVLVGGAAIAALAGVRTWVARRPQLARVSIADAPEGVRVEIVGTIQPGETIEAPLSGRACVHYELEVVFDESRRRGLGPRMMGPGRIRDAQSVPFAIDDGTGRALVDPQGATIVVVPSDKQMRLGDPTPRQRALLSRFGATGGSNQLFREGVLAIGARVAVVGLVVREPDPDGAARASGYRGDAPTRLRLGSAPRHPLEIRDVSDEPG